MPDNRDTTNSCSQCEAYAKRIEELKAEVEQFAFMFDDGVDRWNELRGLGRKEASDESQD